VLGNTLALVALLGFLWSIREVLGWAAVSLLFALAFHPLVAWMMRKGIRRGLAVLIVVIFALGVIAALMGTVIPMLIEQVRSFIERAPEILARVEAMPPVRWADEQFGIIAGFEHTLRSSGTGGVAEPVITVAGSIVHFVLATISIIVLTIFMLLFGDEVVERGMEWIEPTKRAHVLALARRVRQVVGAYVLGSLVVATVGGVVMGITMVALGVPYFLPLGLMMIVLGLIPYIGSTLGAVLVIGMTFATEGIKAAIIVAVVYVVYQQIENHVLQPVVQKRTIHMNPLLIAMVLLAGAALSGVLGALLALPVAGAIQVILQDALRRRAARWGEMHPSPADGA
jgi:predicted PurR-regulated permease PerM